MKLSLPLVGAVAVGMSAIALSANATKFDEFAVDQSNFVAVAVPYNYRKYRLAIIEQIPGQSPCWQEVSGYPTTVDLQLLNFDHTHSCRKAVDSNGYSLRYNGVDDKVEYTLNLVENNGRLYLIADHQDPSRQDLTIGATNGIAEAPMKIELDPNWQFTKRLYQGGAIQHIYLSNNPTPQQPDNVAVGNTAVPPSNNSSTPPAASPSQPPVATQPASQPPTPTATVEGLITQIVTPLSQAVYDTYNSLFTTPSTPSQSTPKP